MQGDDPTTAPKPSGQLRLVGAVAGMGSGIRKYSSSFSYEF